jgi:hypothetical protein
MIILGRNGRPSHRHGGSGGGGSSSGRGPPLRVGVDAAPALLGVLDVEIAVDEALPGGTVVCDRRRHLALACRDAPLLQLRGDRQPHLRPPPPSPTPHIRRLLISSTAIVG